MVTVGVAALAVSGNLEIELGIVDATMQTFVVLVVGLTYGRTLAPATLAAYLAVGSAGAPVFSDPSHPLYLVVQPTAGYLWGMLAAAAVLPLLAERGWDRGLLRPVAAMLLGHAIIFAFGVTWLAVTIGSLDAAVTSGVVPFLPGLVLKSLLALAVLPTAWKLVDRS